ncbi:sulfur transferase domain-containing protein [Hyphobacterium sp. HN65]|uniref:Sulfur transferase domain-containing protein n=1 Tax=Hyphobacterium lacteum TaxID=3116575 RepID=A0ABU7LR57_9PROT|nr:sulfur transferase domain-containing protein [Hyphobacterium sp. HN65]MEE2526399.1 sulfur transferase domain-containing protein [Hyphobacterium sp. HN65]
MIRFVLGFFLMLTACAAADDMPERVTAIHNDVWLAGQPSPEQLQSWADQGRTVIINIRPDDEMAQLPFDESQLALEAGMTYAQFGVGGSAGFNPSMTSALTFQLNLHEGENIVLHCVSGTRAAHIYTAHLIETGQVTPAEANSLGLAPRGELNPIVMRQLSPRFAAAFPE